MNVTPKITAPSESLPPGHPARKDHFSPTSTAALRAVWEFREKTLPTSTKLYQIHRFPRAFTPSAPDFLPRFARV